MDFFVDTSALFKLFVKEEHSHEYLEAMQEADSIYVSAVTWVEFHSALRMCVSRKTMTPHQRNETLELFKKDWKNYIKVHVNEDVLNSAAQLVPLHSLKTLDAIQLASALSIRVDREEPMAFLTADESLEVAARREKLVTTI